MPRVAATGLPKFTGNDTVNGQGTQQDYWKLGTSINNNWIHPENENVSC